MLVEAGSVIKVKFSIYQNCLEASSEIMSKLHILRESGFYLWQICVNDERPQLTDSKDSSESSNQRLCNTRRQE